MKIGQKFEGAKIHTKTWTKTYVQSRISIADISNNHTRKVN